MNLFVGSIAVICAFVVGLLLGARWMWKIVSREGGMIDRLGADAASQHLMATGYAYTQIVRECERGASTSEIQAFAEAELTRLAEAGQQHGARLGDEMVADWKAKEP